MRYSSIIGIASLLAAASAAPSKLRPRQEGKHTKVTLGRNYIDYGCDASIKKTLSEALDDKCGGEAHCDDSTPYTRKVMWTHERTDGDNPPEERDISVTVTGIFPDSETMANLRETILNTVTDDTWQLEDRYWTQSVPHTPTGIGSPGDTGTCPMTRFASFIGVSMYDGDTEDYTVTLSISIDDAQADDGFCSDEGQGGFELLLEPLGTAGGYLGAIAGLACADA